MLVPVLVLPRRPCAWPLAAAAPALGLLGLAGAWPALAGAGRHRLAPRGDRVGRLDLAGLLAAPLAGPDPVPVRRSGNRAGESVAGSPYDTVHHVLMPVLSSGALAAAPVWALAAAVLPWLVRHRSPALDVVRAVLWAGLLAAATMLAVAAVTAAAACTHRAQRWAQRRLRAWRWLPRSW